MMDSQETLQTEENVTENVAPEVNETENQTIEVPQTQEEVVARVKELAEADAPAEKQELDALKQAFYKIHKANVAAARAQFIENGGESEAFLPAPNVLEDDFKAAMNVIKQKRAELQAELDRQKEENLQKKQEILERIKVLSATPEEANQAYKEFKELQNQWKELTLVPAEKANELWKTYQLYVEQYYDQLKLNNEFREYDFKKNLEIKTRLCETAEKLNEEADVISAFQQLQALHQEFKETGPVAKELREEIWARFKAASTAVNKRHQQYFEELKQKEEENLAHKTALCEKIEAVDLTAIKTATAWEAQTQQIIEMQKEWRTIGFAPQKMNVKIFERFRGACDRFFTEKAAFFKRLKEEQAQNLAKKTELCEKAEALKDSTDWKSTTEKMIALQKEWKTIGSVARKHSDAVWKRFITACDYFFEQKNKNVSSQKSVEQTNLAAKKALIEKINTIDEADHDEALATLKGYMTEWNAIGHVPFKEKDKIYKEYHEAVDKQFDRLKVDQNDRKMQTFRNSLSDMSNGERGKGKLYGEREKLMRMYERMKNELQTYENNIGFLSISSKGGGGLLKEMERKIDKLKDEMALIIKKIDAIDENLE